MPGQKISDNFILDGRGACLVPIKSTEEAARLHEAGCTIRLESENDSTHIDRLESFDYTIDWFTELRGPNFSMYAVFRPFCPFH